MTPSPEPETIEGQTAQAVDPATPLFGFFDLSKAVMTKEQEQHIQKTGCCPRPECQPHEGRATPMKWLGSVGRAHSLHCKRCDSVWLVPPPIDEPNCNSAFLRAKLNDVTVARMLKDGAGPEAIIGQLAADKEQYLKRIMELESIAPRKIVLPDGRVMAWQCPLELVPPMNTPNIQGQPRRAVDVATGED